MPAHRHPALPPLLVALFGCGPPQGALPADASLPGDSALRSDLSSFTLPRAELISAAFQFAEGPLWDDKRGVLLLSDISADTIYQLTLPGQITVFRRPSHQSNGLGFDKDGLLLAAEHQSRSVTRTRADGTIATVAATFEGNPLNSPNDLIVRSDGTIYFTDPTYGLGGRPSDLGFTGLYRISPDGVLHLEAKIAGAPNGVALQTDEKTLWVANTSAHRILVFDVAPDGSTGGPRTLAQTVESPDGLAIDRDGNAWIAALRGGRGAVVVLDRDGNRRGEILLDHQPTNCGFGGSDGKTLFVTARAALYRLAAPVPGL